MTEDMPTYSVDWDDLMQWPSQHEKRHAWWHEGCDDCVDRAAQIARERPPTSVATPWSRGDHSSGTSGASSPTKGRADESTSGLQ